MALEIGSCQVISCKHRRPSPPILLAFFSTPTGSTRRITPAWILIPCVRQCDPASLPHLNRPTSALAEGVVNERQRQHLPLLADVGGVGPVADVARLSLHTSAR